MFQRLYDLISILGFSDQYLQSWINLSNGFLKWIHCQVHAGKVEKCRGNFPQLWKQFLNESNQSDEIKWS